MKNIYNHDLYKDFDIKILEKFDIIEIDLIEYLSLIIIMNRY